SMVVLLPRQVEGYGKLEDGLTPALLSRSLSQMKKERVEIFLPRFKLESSFNLNDTLAAMGMPDAFSGQKPISRGWMAPDSSTFPGCLTKPGERLTKKAPKRRR